MRCPPPTNDLDTTPWVSVLLISAASVSCAFQAGKIPAALPLFREEFGLNLIAASWLISAFTLVGAAIGVVAGEGVSRLGLVRSVVFGEVLVALGCVVETMAPGLPVLVTGRVIEGLGFLAVAVSGPLLLRCVVRSADLSVSFALWSSAIPTGIALAMLLGPLLPVVGWRTVWLASGLMAAAVAALIAKTCSPTIPLRVGNAGAPLGRILRDGVSWQLSTAFGLYTLGWYAVIAFLPTLLSSQFGMAPAMVGPLSACVVAINIAGNLVSGLMRRGGMAAWACIFGAALGMAAYGFVMSAGPSSIVSLLSCLGFSAIAGLLPSAVFEFATERGLGGPTFGLIQQGVNVGQLAGPLLVGGAVQIFDWSAAGWPVIVAASALAAIAWRLRANDRLASTQP